MDHQERWYLDNIPMNGKVIADVGANVGRLSQFFWKHGGPTCRLLSVEPEPGNVARIQGRIHKAATDRWTVAACAVSKAAGTLQMRAFDVSYGRNSVATSEVQGDPGEPIEVRCETLATLAPEAEIVKVDIEGHEYAVLPDAVAEMESVRVWALELHYLEGNELGETFELLQTNGFELLGAANKRGDASGSWHSAPIPSGLSWAQVPGTKMILDGVPALFKMLHVLAKR